MEVRMTGPLTVGCDRSTLIVCIVRRNGLFFTQVFTDYQIKTIADD
jgi:hypothetical protein